jgi:hypothetical protein
VLPGVALGTSGPESSYEKAAQTLGVGVGTVKTVIYRLRKQYLTLVREEAARTVSDRAEVEALSRGPSSIKL